MTIPSVREQRSAEAAWALLEPTEIATYRRRVWGDVAPPFAAAEDWQQKDNAAREWIRQQNYRQPWQPSPNLPTGEEITIELIHALNEQREREEPPPPKSVYFPTQHDGIWWAPATYPTELYRFGALVDRIADSTNFASAAVTWWILTGFRPTLPRLRLSRQGMYADWIRLDVHARDLTRREWLAVYHAIRHTSGQRRQRVNPMHARIIELVAAAGGAPATEYKRAFWDDTIAAQLRRERRWKRLPTWRGIKLAYDRATDRLHPFR